MKKLFFLLFTFLLLGGVFFYFFQKSRSFNDSQKVVYNPITQKWEQFSKSDPIKQDRETILKDMGNSSEIHNQSVLKGYFDHHDENTQVLTLKTTLAFSQNNLFELRELKLLPSQSIYCAPSMYTDPNTGKNYAIEKLVIPVKTGETLWIPTEKIISFDNFLAKSTNRTFIYLQLTENYDKQATNYIKKLIVIGLCD